MVESSYERNNLDRFMHSLGNPCVTSPPEGDAMVRQLFDKFLRICSIPSGSITAKVQISSNIEDAFESRLYEIAVVPKLRFVCRKGNSVDLVPRVDATISQENSEYLSQSSGHLPHMRPLKEVGFEPACHS